eukprot:366221-Chlamydomonas_euryale.AAC.7
MLDPSTALPSELNTFNGPHPFVTAPYPLLDPLCLATLNTGVPFTGPLAGTLMLTASDTQTQRPTPGKFFNFAPGFHPPPPIPVLVCTHALRPRPSYPPPPSRPRPCPILPPSCPTLSQQPRAQAQQRGGAPRVPLPQRGHRARVAAPVGGCVAGKLSGWAGDRREGAAHQGRLPAQARAAVQKLAAVSSRSEQIRKTDIKQGHAVKHAWLAMAAGQLAANWTNWTNCKPTPRYLATAYQSSIELAKSSIEHAQYSMN